MSQLPASRAPAGEDILAGLDPQQRAAVLHVDGPGLIVAGAGAGKTTVLVRRTAHLVRSGVDPANILLLTFTRASAKSILDRAAAFVPEARGFFGGTFHSVAARVIRDNHGVFGLPEGFTVIDPGDVDDTLKRLIADTPTDHRMVPRSSTFAKVISFSRNTQQSIENVLMLPQFNEHWHLTGYFAEIAKAYRDYKKRLAILDFDDLLEFWARLVEHPDLGGSLRQRFRYVMVDEHQDSNALQLRIIYGLGGGDGNVLAVGDPSQSIYGFRGSAPGTMFDFRRHWPQTKTYLIETNYRSAPEIVELADRVDRALIERFDRTLRASRPSAGKRPRLIHTFSPDTEADWIVSKVLEYREDGVPLDKQAVLVRSMRRARTVEAKLTMAGIPYRVFGGVKLHEAAHIKDVISVLRIATNPGDEPAWLRYLTLFKGFGPKKALKLAAQFTDAGSAEDALDRLRDMALTRADLAILIPALRAAIAARDAMNALDAVIRELRPVLEAKWADEFAWRERDLEDIVNLAATLGSVEDFLRTITIDVSIDKQSEAQRARQVEEAPMVISTVHGAKGLEWDVVYIPSFVSGHFPSQYAEPGDGDEEEKRLLYVAVTRARYDLYLMRPSSILIKGEPMMVRESHFQPLIARDLEVIHNEAVSPIGSLTLETTARIDAW